MEVAVETLSGASSLECVVFQARALECFSASAVRSLSSAIRGWTAGGKPAGEKLVSIYSRRVDFLTKHTLNVRGCEHAEAPRFVAKEARCRSGFATTSLLSRRCRSETKRGGVKSGGSRK